MDIEKIKEKLKDLPLSPGVYIMKDKDNKVIYVGKSKALKNRVSQYFMNLKSHSPKTAAMVSHVDDFKYIVTDSEVEALILECNLIKKYRPQYNILLKDDKHYPYIKITAGEEYPRIYMTRKIINDGGKYFGPYMSAGAVKTALETIKKIFKVRSCSKQLPVKGGRPCLYYHIGQCSAPCSNIISQEEYKEAFSQISNVLAGKYKEITDELTKKMLSASENLEFERAARLRDAIESVKSLGEKQKMLSTTNDNRDIIAVYTGEFDSCINIFFMRDGRIQGSEQFFFEENQLDEGDLIAEFMKQYYFNATFIPKEILISKDSPETESIADWLTQKCGNKITVSVPKRGEKAKLILTVKNNAEESLKQYYFTRNREKMEQNAILSELTDVLNLDKVPFRIESYDISNISGENSVGVCVVYKDAKPSKKDYRKFNIKTVDGADDYESTREVIFRRINRAYDELDQINKGTLSPEKAKFLPLPDLILLDGGVGHVNSIKMLMETLGEEIPVFGLSKDDRHRTRALVDENGDYDVKKNSPLFLFLADIQEEVHRFAIKAFRAKHTKAEVKSILENINGIGEAKRKKLLNSFITLERIKTATYEELCEVLDKTSAKNVYDYFKGDDENGK